MNMNLSPMERARQIAETVSSSSYQASNYFNMNDGETKYYRPLSTMVPTYTISHGCGANLLDIPVSQWSAAVSAGQSVICPNCGQPLTDADIVYKRPYVIGAELHNYVQYVDENGESKHGTFLCLGGLENAANGYVPSVNGAPQYACPICSSPKNVNKNGKPKHPSYCLYGLAVEREPVFDVVTKGGIRVNHIVDMKDVMDTNDEGIEIPRIVIINKSYTALWGKFAASSPDYSVSICYFDWAISRNGTKLNTSWDVQQLNIENPTVVDMRPYEAYMPDVEAMLTGMGSPDRYNKKGWPVQGYVPQEVSGTPAAGAQAAISQAAAPASNFAGMPQVQTPWGDTPFGRQ